MNIAAEVPGRKQTYSYYNQTNNSPPLAVQQLWKGFPKFSQKEEVRALEPYYTNFFFEKNEFDATQNSWV